MTDLRAALERLQSLLPFTVDGTRGIRGKHQLIQSINTEMDIVIALNALPGLVELAERVAGWSWTRDDGVEREAVVEMARRLLSWESERKEPA